MQVTEYVLLSGPCTLPAFVQWSSVESRSGRPPSRMVVVQSCGIVQSYNAIIHSLDSGFLLFSLAAFPVHGMFLNE
jgi:hypothetical protein